MWEGAAAVPPPCVEGKRGQGWSGAGLLVSAAGATPPSPVLSGLHPAVVPALQCPPRHPHHTTHRPCFLMTHLQPWNDPPPHPHPARPHLACLLQPLLQLPPQQLVLGGLGSQGVALRLQRVGGWVG